MEVTSLQSCASTRREVKYPLPWASYVRKSQPIDKIIARVPNECFPIVKLKETKSEKRVYVVSFAFTKLLPISHIHLELTQPPASKECKNRDEIFHQTNDPCILTRASKYLAFAISDNDVVVIGTVMSID